MSDNRSGKDRRVNPDRRKGGDSSYNGIENRDINPQRSNKDRREINNNIFMKRALSHGNVNNRSGIDQRQFSYTGVVPERRSGKDRRSAVSRHTN